MVLLDDVVQVPDGPTSAAAAEFSGLLQFIDHSRIRRVPVDVDYPRPWMTR
jgi:hypothetical protein